MSSLCKEGPYFGEAMINARYLLKSPLEFRLAVGAFKALKMKA
jgi:hypothetical protein